MLRIEPRNVKIPLRWRHLPTFDPDALNCSFLRSPIEFHRIIWCRTWCICLLNSQETSIKLRHDEMFWLVQPSIMIINARPQGLSVHMIKSPLLAKHLLGRIEPVWNFHWGVAFPCLECDLSQVEVWYLTLDVIVAWADGGVFSSLLLDDGAPWAWF